MTTTTATRSAYPAAVEELIPRARQLADQLDRPLSRNILMKHFRIGSPKASAVLEALADAANLDGDEQDAQPAVRGVLALVSAPPAEPPAADPEPITEDVSASKGTDLLEEWVPRPLTQSGEPLPPAPLMDPAEIAAGPWPSATAPQVEPVEDMPPAPAVLSSDAEIPAETEVPRRGPRSGAVVALVASAVATVTGVVAGAHAPAAVILGQPWPVLTAAIAAVVAVLLVFGWSAASVFGRLLTGRTARDVALDLASWTVAAVAGYLAAYGQVKFAQWAGVTGNMRFLVPGILEPSVVVLLLLANRRVKRRRAGYPAKPVGKLLTLAAVLGGFAVYTNVVHAGGKAGLVFGAATVVGLILWWVKLQDDAAPDDWDDAPQSKRLSRRTSRYRLLRWVILPGQTRRAWLISLDHSIADAEAGLNLARRWRRAYDESRQAKVSRRLARHYASQQIDAYLLNQH